MHSRRETSLLTVRYPRPMRALPGSLNIGHKVFLHVNGAEMSRQTLSNELMASEVISIVIGMKPQHENSSTVDVNFIYQWNSIQ
jgi:hypothetical protein